ncbi:transmembrane protease serine 9-like [Culex pipiens pallens]|uniref:transmembrane protease serine 9-like n=1 Tax=Culex pipiens pallens TaxID=42434 RepID=UPI001952F994|nr:transmembrane protease serine 9-like [Culex pipiens pallens]
MMILRKGMLIAVVMLVTVVMQFINGDNAFIDDPPDGYFSRTSLDDCPSRFYSDDVSSALGFFIFGGLRAFRSEYPHMTALGWTDPSTGKPDYACGGSLISDRFVVTAAHCGQNENKIPPDVVRLGDTNLATSEDDAFAQDIKIKRFNPHPSYKRTQKYFDIALIELEHAARLDAAVCPICLWTKDNLYKFSGGLQVTGFGITDYASDPSPTLQKATLNYYDYDHCNTMLPRPRSLFRGLSSDHFCAKTPQKDTCHGDSGGPIQIELSDVNKAIPFLAGVTSFGTGCWDGSFGVYTKISSYVDWIASNVNVTVDPMECARQSECLSSRKFSDSRLSPQNNSPFFRVELRRGGQSFKQCSGALIDYRHVVTSASCTKWNGQEPTQIEANDQLININSIVRHPRYVAGKHYNDLAVLQLEKFYNLNKIYQIVAPACVWKNDRIPEPIVFYSGSGPDSSGSDNGKITSVPLKILTAFYLENGRCAANYSEKFKDELPGGFNNDFVCAENPVELIPGICQLEPGGPISNFRRDNVVPYVYGINTLGTECGGTGNLFVATRISSYYPWIESIVLNKTSRQTSERIDTADDEFSGNAIDVVSRSVVPYEDDLVSYVLPGLLATDHRLRPYGGQLVPGGLSPLATASVHTGFNDRLDSPVKITIYGAQLSHIPERPEDLLQTLSTIQLQSAHHVPPPRPTFIQPNSIEIVKSVELGAKQPSRQIHFHQSHPQSTYSNPTVPFRPQQWSSHHHQTSFINHRRPYVTQPRPRLLVSNPSPYLGGQPTPSSFTIEKSIELYPDGRCTLGSGQAGRCLPRSLCPGGGGGGLSYCNGDLLTVCCPTI